MRSDAHAKPCITKTVLVTRFETSTVENAQVFTLEKNQNSSLLAIWNLVIDFDNLMCYFLEISLL